MGFIKGLKALFGHVDAAEPISGFNTLPQVNGIPYMRTLVREVDGRFETHSLFLRPQPDTDIKTLIEAVQAQLPENGSFMVTQQTEADESFDYYRISVSSFDLVSKEQMEALAKKIDIGMEATTPSSPAPAGRAPVPA